MATIEQITELLQISENRIVERLEKSLEEKVTKITEGALKSINKKVNNNSETIRNISDTLDITKENSQKNIEDLSNLKEDVDDNTLKIQNIEKYRELTEVRMKDMEEVLNEKAYVMSFADKQRIKNIEMEIKKFKEKLDKKDDKLDTTDDDNKNEEQDNMEHNNETEQSPKYSEMAAKIPVPSDKNVNINYKQVKKTSNNNDTGN